MAQLVVDIVPGERGLRSLASAFPKKIRGTFQGLMDSYKSQMMIAAGDDDIASRATTYIFKDMVKAYAGPVSYTHLTLPTKA